MTNFNQTLEFKGVADRIAKFVQTKGMETPEYLKDFVEMYRIQPDGENQGWKGEFWGKTIRGYALVYEYTRDKEYYELITESVRDMLTVAEADGRVSSYARDAEFDSWDIWCRKYVMLGMEYYLDICEDDELKQEIIRFIKGCADYIIKHIGNGEGQKAITDASRSWGGINSSSVLEPMVRLYNLTKEAKYLDFATYIIENGGAKGVNIFERAYENKLPPYQYGVSKAYELMSCFEGLLEYYYVTGIEKYKTAVINFGKAVIDTEISVIGTCGVTHELFDHTKARQTVDLKKEQQETCVTVTLMKLCSRLWELTKDTAFLDCIEHSFYNAYVGAVNTEWNICEFAREKWIVKKQLPKIVDTYLLFDSYSPLIPKRRGIKIGGNQLLPNLTYHGCCECIGAAGVGMFLRSAVVANEDGIFLNFFEAGKSTICYKGINVELNMETEYPADGKIKIGIKAEKPISFALMVRVPGWAEEKGGYLSYEKEWFEDEISLEWDMKLRTILPKKWDKDVVYTDCSQCSSICHIALPEEVEHKEEEDNYISLMRGPLTLAADSRSGKDASSVFDFEPIGELCEDKEIIPGVPCLLKMRFKERNGETFYLVDYGSAGLDWETEIAAWLPTKER